MTTTETGGASLVGELDYTPEPGFGAPFIDLDEWREEPRRHRYIHGGFTGTHTRFSFYFPPQALYRGRLIQFLEGGAGGHENLLASAWSAGLSLSWLFQVGMEELGAFLVESNQGHFSGEGLGTRNDGTDQARVNLFEASAQTALFGRWLARKIYGEPPHHSYIWGVSGGGLRTVYALENRPDVWDGGAPHAGVHNTTQWSAWGLAWLHARKKFAGIIDAMEPGGSGNPFAGLTHVQREALADLYRRGYPRGAENQLAPFAAWPFTLYGVKDEDPSYFTDFWNEPGYLGHDEPQLLRDVLVSERTTVRKVYPASEVTDIWAQMHVRLATAGAAGSDPTWGASFDLDLGGDPQKLFMCTVRVLTGKAAGRELVICGVDGEMVSPFRERSPDLFQDVAPGDEVSISNKDFIAFCHYHRYAVEGMIASRDKIVDQLLPWTVDRTAIYPQRAQHGRRGENSGHFRGKMIYVQPTKDNMVWNTTISGYHGLVREHLGARIDEQFRLWWVENAPHGSPDVLGPMVTDEKDPHVWLSRLVAYDGVSAQALRELVRWVEDGAAPTASGPYALSRDNALILPGTAAERGGVQPVVAATVDGGLRADVRVGQTVSFRGVAEQPPGMGTILRAEWDFRGRGAWEPAEPAPDGISAKIEASASYAFSEPGVYFASFRVAAHCDGRGGRAPLIENLARVRVVVHA